MKKKQKIKKHQKNLIFRQTPKFTSLKRKNKMFGFIKKGMEFNRLANSFGEVYIKLQRFESLFNARKENIPILRENYKLDILALGYIISNEIINKIEEHNWSFESQIIVNKISNNKITVMQAWSQTVTKVHFLIGLLELQKEYEDIVEKKPISNVIKNYLENDRLIDKMSR